MARTSASALIMVACLLLAVVVRPGSAAITCGQVASALRPCLPYLRANGPLILGCCNGVRGLNNLAQTTPDRQQACNCLKTIAARTPNLVPALTAGLPGKCGVSVGYPISTSTDCTKVH